MTLLNPNHKLKQSNEKANINEDPLFEGSGNHPYQLSSASPCIDLGSADTSGLNLPAADLIGNIRTWDGDNNGSAIIDMGAYEYVLTSVNIDKPILDELSHQNDFKVFPNPVYYSTTIELIMEEIQEVFVSVYNQFGEKKETIFQGVKGKGNHRLTWNSENLPSGIYFIKLQTKNSISTQKVIKR